MGIDITNGADDGIVILPINALLSMHDLPKNA